MNKKIIALILVLTMGVSLLVGCTNNDNENITEDVTGDIKVALVTSSGGLGDRSFNDAAWEGFERAKAELGVEIKVVEPQSVADYSNSLSSVADSGFDFVMVVGNDWVDTLTTVAAQYSDVKFAGVNINLEAPNVAIARFSDHEGSFLVGALAALMSDTGTIGFIGGNDVPAINRFFVGYEEGAKYANPEINVLNSYVGSFADPGKGKEFALQQNDNDADIIFHAAGKTGEGLFEAVKEVEKLYAIGVDQDQDYIAPGKILTSMEKRVDVAAFDFINQVVEGNFSAKETIYGLSEDGVGLTDMEYTKEIIPTEVLNQVDDIKEKISNGEIKVTDVFETN